MHHDVYQIAPKDFPRNIREIPDPPEKLFVRGTLAPKDNVYLAVVGSRALSSYGKEVLDYLFRGLSGYPISIISGLALGTDGLAHRLALMHDLHTVAIPGSGIDDAVLYPRSHKKLAGEILDADGALLSEFEPNFRATIWSFPKRNRLMAGMADVVFMLEAGEKSGTLITARMASEYNRELLTVPHPIFSQNGKGPHQFLRLGATLVTEPEHILEALNLTPNTQQAFSIVLTETEQALFNLLTEPLSRDEIIRALKMPAHETLRTLATLEIKGVVREAGGKIFRIHEAKKQ